MTSWKRASIVIFVVSTLVAVGTWSIRESPSPSTIFEISQALVDDGPDVALEHAADFASYFVERDDVSAISRADTIRAMSMALATNDSLPESRLPDLIPFMNSAVDLVSVAHERDPKALDVFENTGQLYYFLSRYEEAALVEEAGLRYRRDLPDVDPAALAEDELNLAKTMAELGRQDQALELCSRARPVLEADRESHLAAVVALNNVVGTIYLGRGAHREAIPVLEQALADHLDLVSRNGSQDPDAIERLRDQRHGIQINLAAAFQALGRRGKARGIYEALELSFESQGAQDLHRIQVAIALSFVDQRESRYDRAYSRLQDAASEFGASDETDVRMRARVLNAIATFCLETERFAEGLSQAEEAVQLLESLGERSRNVLPLALLRQAQLSAQFGDHDRTRALFESALLRQGEVTGPESPEVAQILVERVRWWRKRDRSSDAGVSDLLRAQDILESSSSFPRYRVHAGAMLCQTMWTAGRRAEAIEQMEAALGHAETVRDWSSDSALGRAGTLSQYLRYIHQLAAWKFDEGDQTGAWDALQRGRARELRERIALGAAVFPNSNDSTTDTPAEHSASLRDIRQSIAKRQSILLHYAVDSADAQVYVVSDTGLERHSLVIPGNHESATTIAIQELVTGSGHSKDLRVLLGRRTEPFEADTAQRLFELRQTFVPDPVLQKLRHASSVFVVGADALGVLPLECLVLEAGAEVVSTDFWIDSLPRIHYLPSAAMLGTRDRAATMKVTKALVVVEPDLKAMRDSRHPLASRVRSLGGLPFATEEVEAIRSAMMAGDIKELTGEAATELEVLKALRDADLVHFATHALAEQRLDHDVAALVLTPTGTTGRAVDGFLDADEISAMKIPATLVTLAACNSGYGRIVPGEGVFALGRSFLEAGAGSVIATAWPIRDWASAQLFREFYSHGFRTESDLSEAFWESRIILRHGEETSHPADWGAYVWLGI